MNNAKLFGGKTNDAAYDNRKTINSQDYFWLEFISEYALELVVLEYFVISLPKTIVLFGQVHQKRVHSYCQAVLYHMPYNSRK